MSIWDWVQSDDGARLVSGSAGAAVSAVVEWHGWTKALRAFFVGAMSAYFISDVIFPVLATTLGWLSVAPDRQAWVSGFISGAIGIFFIEFLIAFVRNMTASARSKANGNGENDGSSGSAGSS